MEIYHLLIQFMSRMKILKDVEGNLLSEILSLCGISQKSKLPTKMTQKLVDNLVAIKKY